MLLRGGERDESNLAGVLVYLVADKRDGIRCRRSIGRPAGPFLLREGYGIGRLRPLSDHHIFPPQGCQETANQQRARTRVSPSGSDTDDVQARVLKGNRQCECVIDVVANIRVDDHRL